MEVNWNNLKLQHPPYSTWCTSQNIFDVKTFVATIEKAIRGLESMNMLDIEAAFLSRLIYRMKNKFRNDKGLKSMEKMNRVLINYLNMALIQDYKNLKSYIHLEEKVVTLPSRQLLEYVLVRTQGFAKLMQRLEQVARYSAHFLRMRIKLGHAWSISLIAYAIVSRIWLLSRQLIKSCCMWYKELYQYVDMFQYIGIPWIPKNQFLPNDLEQWLSVEWMHNEKIDTSHGIKWDNTVLKLFRKHSLDHDATLTTAKFDLMTCNSLDSLQKDIIHDISENKPILHTNINDIGEVIDRKTFKASFSKVYKHDAGTSLVQKRKHINADIKNKQTKKKIKNFTMKC